MCALVVGIGTKKSVYFSERVHTFPMSELEGGWSKSPKTPKLSMAGANREMH